MDNRRLQEGKVEDIKMDAKIYVGIAAMIRRAD